MKNQWTINDKSMKIDEKAMKLEIYGNPMQKSTENQWKSMQSMNDQWKMHEKIMNS